MTKKVFIRTMGCQMNVRDSEVIRGLLEKEGYSFTDEPGKADIIIYNTCSVRQHAEDKVWSEVGRITKMYPHDLAYKPRQIKTGGTTSPQSGKKIIGLVGCMAQAYKEKIFERAPNVSFVVGTSDIAKLPEIINKLKTLGRVSCCKEIASSSAKVLWRTPRNDANGTVPVKIWETESKARPDEIYHTGFYEDKSHAYVVISEGCSNFCSYCIVPYVRSHLRNRKTQDILREISEAVDKGIKKITLLGQNVNAYQDDGVDFVQLLRKVNDISGLGEFSFITSHPKDISLELFEAIPDLEKLMKHLHLPVQSGSNRILGLMNRGYTRESYLDLVSKYRKSVKISTLSTDIIVGFPSETENDFQDTFELVRNAGFDSAYIFKYSPRPYTEAANLVDDITREEKEKRHRIILDLQKGISKNNK